jgi:outer membrane protein assembly factor BamE
MMKSIRTALPRARQLATAAAVMIALIAAAGCVHRIDIQQGNFLESKDIDRISVGMTRLQVRSLLGTPMVADPFQGSRWDYLYYLKRGKLQRVERRHFIVHFDSEDKVARIERPTETASAAKS